MEYCPRGTLDVMLHHSAAARWDSAKLVSMVRSIARGMLHLHTRKPPMLHRDLKPGNIFVGEVGHSLAAALGHACNTCQSLGSCCYCACHLCLSAHNPFTSHIMCNNVVCSTTCTRFMNEEGETQHSRGTHTKPAPRLALYVAQDNVVCGLKIIAHLICRPKTDSVNLEIGKF